MENGGVPRTALSEPAAGLAGPSTLGASATGAAGTGAATSAAAGDVGAGLAVDAAGVCGTEAGADDVPAPGVTGTTRDALGAAGAAVDAAAAVVAVVPGVVGGAVLVTVADRFRA